MSFSVLGTFLALLQVLSLHQYLYIQLLEGTPTTRISNLLLLSYEILFLQYCFYKILDFFQLYFSCFPYGKISIHLPSSSLIPLSVIFILQLSHPSEWVASKAIILVLNAHLVVLHGFCFSAEELGGFPFISRLENGYKSCPNPIWVIPESVLLNYLFLSI